MSSGSRWTTSTDVAGFKLTIEIEGEKQVSRYLDGIRMRFTDLRPAMEWIADNVFMPAIKEQFATQGRRSGRPWGPYTAAEVESGYVAYKTRELGKAEPILRWTRGSGSGVGAREVLYPSFVQRTHPDHVRRVTRDSVEVGSKVPWARKHHLGQGLGWRGKYQLPRRTIVALIDSDKAQMAAAIQTYAVTGGFGKIGQGRMFV